MPNNKSHGLAEPKKRKLATSLAVMFAIVTSGLNADAALASEPLCNATTSSAVIDSENVTLKTISPTEETCRILIPAGNFTAVVTGGGGGGGGGASSDAGGAGGGGGGGGKAGGPGGTLGWNQYLLVGVGSGGAGGAGGINGGSAASNGSAGGDSFITIAGTTYSSPGGAGGLAGSTTGGAGGNSGNDKTGSSGSGLQGGQGGSSSFNSAGASTAVNSGNTQSYTGTSVTRGSGGGGANDTENGLMGNQTGDGGRGGRGTNVSGNGTNGASGKDGEVIIIFSGTLPASTNTVTYDSNGGTAVDNCVSEGTECTEPSAPTKSGEHFVGWYTDDGTFEDKVSFPFEPEEDVTLHAFWISYTYSSSTLCPGQSLDISVSGIETGEPGPFKGGHYVSFGPTVTFEPWINDEYLDLYRQPDTNFMGEGFENVDYSEVAPSAGELKVIFYENLGTSETPISGTEIFRSVIKFKASCSSSKAAKYAPNTPSEADLTVSSGSGYLKIDVNYSGASSYKPVAYNVKVSPGGNSCVIYGANSSCQVIGLSAGVEYSVSVSATNKYGTSESLVLPTKYVLTQAGLLKFESKKAITGFTQGSAKLKKSLKSAISNYINSSSGLTAITCNGFPGEKPFSKGNKALSKLRAKNVCAYVEKIKPSLVTTIVKSAVKPVKFPTKSQVLMRGYSALH